MQNMKFNQKNFDRHQRTFYKSISDLQAYKYNQHHMLYNSHKLKAQTCYKEEREIFGSCPFAKCSTDKILKSARLRPSRYAPLALRRDT